MPPVLRSVHVSCCRLHGGGRLGTICSETRIIPAAVPALKGDGEYCMLSHIRRGYGVCVFPLPPPPPSPSLPRSLYHSGGVCVSSTREAACYVVRLGSRCHLILLPAGLCGPLQTFLTSLPALQQTSILKPVRLLCENMILTPPPSLPPSPSLSQPFRGKPATYPTNTSSFSNHNSNSLLFPQLSIIHS